MRQAYLARAFAIGIAFVACLCVGLLLIAYSGNRGDAVTISVSPQPSEPARTVFRVESRMGRSIQLFAFDQLARAGTNWVQVGHVYLGSTNLVAGHMNFDVPPPQGWKDWKVRLVYMPEMSGFKLLKWRLKFAWESRNIPEAFHNAFDPMTGWDGAHYAYSEELHQ